MFLEFGKKRKKLKSRQAAILGSYLGKEKEKRR